MVMKSLDDLTRNLNIKPSDLADGLKDILMENANRSNLKKKKRPNRNTSEPWFDITCTNMKNVIRKMGHELKEKPDNQELREKLRKSKAEFKKLTRSKKRNYKHDIIDQMITKKYTDPKGYWNLLKKISPSKNNDTGGITHSEFNKHFQTLLTSKDPVTLPADNTNFGPLDYEISGEELEDASYILKPYKSHGADVVSNEMIKSLLDCHPKVILALFNAILKSGEIIPDWIIGLMVPIHKKGDKSDPGNYRGITLMSCLGKLFIAILNNRLIAYATENNILSISQLGFVAGNRCSDAHIIINNIVRKYCHKKGEKIYSCFVDFSKAFDTVPRDILMNKLQKYGITGRFFNVIKNIYMDDKACVKMDNQRGELFDINQGVRQGCVLSPLLFNIFIADLAKELEELDGKIKIKNKEINSIFWADDIIMLADSQEHLQRMLNLLEDYCKKNKLQVNTDKTKTMIFNKTGRQMRRPFKINGTILESVRMYKYLGFILTPSGEINTGLNDLKDRSLRAFSKIKKDLGESFDKDIKTTLTIIDTMIKPIMMYNSDFWGCMKLPKNNPIEVTHMKICKQLLGVHKTTTNLGVLLETGRVPWYIHAIKASIKNWERIRKSQANLLLIDSYTNAIDEQLPWIVQIRNILETNGMLEHYLNLYEDKPIFINQELYQKLIDQFHQNAFETINNADSKLRTYAIFKKEKEN